MVAIQRRLDQSVQRTLRWIFVLLGGLAIIAFAAWVAFGQFQIAMLNTVYDDRVVPLRSLALIADTINVRIPGRYHSGEYEAEASPTPADDWAQIEALWRAYMLTYLTPKEATLAAQARTSLDDLRERLLDVGLDRSLGTGHDGAYYVHALRIFNERFTALYELQVDVALENLNRARTVTHWAIVLAALALVLMLLLAMLALKVISQRVIAPVEWVARSLQRLAEGDVVLQQPRFPLSAEFSELLDQMNRVRQFLGQRQQLLEEEQAASQRLRDTQTELVEAEKLASLGSLVAGVAHELNTPLGVSVEVASSLEEKRKRFALALAEGGIKRSMLEGFLADVQQASELLTQNLARAAGLVRSFKQVSVDRAGSQRRRFDLARTLDEVLASLRPSLRGKGIAVHLQVPAGIALDSYPGALGQVVTNLINNAAVHAFGDEEPDPAHARCVSLVCFEAAPGLIGLRVSDNGNGMSEEVLSRVFEPFFTTRLGHGGSGLGMAIVHNIVVGLLGGRLQVRSEPGAGTSIDIQLPPSAPQRDHTHDSQEAVIYAVH